jgi:hypothetical protein
MALLWPSGAVFFSSCDVARAGPLCVIIRKGKPIAAIVMTTLDRTRLHLEIGTKVRSALGISPNPQSFCDVPQRKIQACLFWPPSSPLAKISRQPESRRKRIPRKWDLLTRGFNIRGSDSDLRHHALSALQPFF